MPRAGRSRGSGARSGFALPLAAAFEPALSGIHDAPRIGCTYRLAAARGDAVA